LRFVFTRRLESIPLIRSNDFRMGAESRYTQNRIVAIERSAYLGRFNLGHLPRCFASPHRMKVLRPLFFSRK
jgi:hypothetical protein